MPDSTDYEYNRVTRMFQKKDEVHHSSRITPPLHSFLLLLLLLPTPAQVVEKERVKEGYPAPEDDSEEARVFREKSRRKELVLTAGGELLTADGQVHSSLLLTPLSSSLFLTPSHSSSLFLIPTHSSLFLLIPPHSSSFLHAPLPPSPPS